jgi:hypothetical protein
MTQLGFLYSSLECKTITAAHVSETETLYVDDEGLYKDRDYFFGIKGAPQEFYAGNGMICGVKKDGSANSTKFTAGIVEELVTFHTREELHRNKAVL